MKGHGIAPHKGGHMPSLLYRKLADTTFRHPHTPQVDGTVSGTSGNHILAFFRKPPHSGLPKASKAGFSASSFHTSKVSVREKDIWGRFRRRHGSCVVLLDDHNPSDVHSQIDMEVGMFHTAVEVEVQSCHSDSLFHRR